MKIRESRTSGKFTDIFFPKEEGNKENGNPHTHGKKEHWYSPNSAGKVEHQAQAQCQQFQALTSQQCLRFGLFPAPPRAALPQEKIFTLQRLSGTAQDNTQGCRNPGADKTSCDAPAPSSPTPFQVQLDLVQGEGIKNPQTKQVFRAVLLTCFPSPLPPSPCGAANLC